MRHPTDSAIAKITITRTWLYFLVGLVAGFVSKSGALTNALSPDDYFFAFAPVSNAHQFIAVGRGLEWLLSVGVERLGATLETVQFLSFWLSLAALAWYTAVVAELVARDRVSRWIVAGCVAVVAAHPYLSTYFVFRMALLTNAVAFGAATWALLVLVHDDRTSVGRTLFSAVIVGVLCNLFQSVLLLFMVGSFGWLLASMCRNRDLQGRWSRTQCNPVFLVAISILVAAVVYFVSSSLTRHIAGVPANPSYTPHLQGGLAGIAHSEWKLIKLAVAGNQAIFPARLKWWGCALLALVTLAWWKPGAGHWIIAGFLFAGAGWVLAALPMATSLQRFVPRVFFLLGPVTGISYLFLASAWRRPFDRWLGVAFLVLAGLFCIPSSAMFFQQRLQTQWDETLARSIFFDASHQGLLGSGELRIVAQWPIHPYVLPIHAEGVNDSGFLYGWSLQNLFRAATGTRIDVGPGSEAECAGKPRWPEPGYLFRGRDGHVYACVGGVSGSIVRGYPSAAEESALHLKYPIFHRFGQSTARITPFPPGTPGRAVSVGLVPSIAGYAIRMASGTCAFPVDYTLTDGNGQTVVSGEYRGTNTVTLPGWNALTGTAVLSVSMAAGARNNHGCNILVTPAMR